MANRKSCCSRIWLKALISVLIVCSSIVWAGGNPPVAEDKQPNKAAAGAKTPEKTTSPATEQPHKKQPDIFFPETKHAFGKVFIGEKVKHKFKFVNKGDAILHIREITTACECTGTKPGKWHIAPGEEEELTVSFSPDESNSLGKTVKFVYVYTNDPDTPKSKLRFTVNVRKDIVYNPQGFELGYVALGNAGTKRIVFKSKLNPTGLEITKVTTFSPSVGVSHGKLNDNGEWFVDVSIKEAAKIGRQDGNITVYTNSTKQPVVKISTSGEVLQEVSAMPKRICFGKVLRGKESVRSITIHHAKDIKIEKIEPSLSWISANIIPGDSANNGSSAEVELKLSSTNAPKGKSTGVLSIHTNSKKFPVLKVHLCGNVLEPRI